MHLPFGSFARIGGLLATLLALQPPLATASSVSSSAHPTDRAALATTTTQITLNGSSIAVSGSGVTVAGTLATITAAGSYSISGTLNDGQIRVDTDDEEPVELMFNGLNISNSTSAPIYVKEADSVEIVLAEGTDNRLSDGASYVYDDPEDDEPDAALFSDDDLTISGSGSLTVNANYKRGITSKDGLIIESGTINVTSADDGIRGRDYLLIQGGTITVDAGADGLKSNNDEDTALGYVRIEGGVLDLTTAEDGIQAETYLTISGGDVTIVAGGGSSVPVDDDVSTKGLKSGKNTVIYGGTFAINASDDAIHSKRNLTIHNGSFELATGDDAIHADIGVTINGGDILITTSNEGIEGVTVTINSGTIALTASDDGINAAGDIIVDDTVGDDTTTAIVYLPVVSLADATDTEALQPAQTTATHYVALNGGFVAVYASGDGIDANGDITMSGGTVLVHGPTQNGNGPIDYDGSFTISGGLLVAVGSSGMAQAPGTSSSQNSLKLTYTSTQQASTLIHIQNSAGDDLLTFRPSKSYQSLVFSSPDLLTGESYQVYSGGSTSGDANHGLYEQTSYTAGSQYTSFTVSSVVTTVGGGGGRR